MGCKSASASANRSSLKRISANVLSTNKLALGLLSLSFSSNSWARSIWLFSAAARAENNKLTSGIDDLGAEAAKISDAFCQS